MIDSSVQAFPGELNEIARSSPLSHGWCWRRWRDPCAAQRHRLGSDNEIYLQEWSRLIV